MRGKAHAEWKIVVNGEKRTVRDDQYFMDARNVIWGNGNIYAHAQPHAHSLIF